MMPDLRHENGLSFWQDEALLPMPHGFFTRLGGVSSGELSGLNCGYGSNDRHEDVSENRRLVSQTLQSHHPVQTVYQHHSADVVVLDGPLESIPKADAIVTKVRALPIAVLTADCAPVLFLDPEAGVIGAAHAGWRGAFAGVLANTVREMEKLGARVSQIRAVVGPCISQKNYEVQSDFVENFLDENKDFNVYFSGQDKFFFDLSRFVLDQLRFAGLSSVSWLKECTYQDAEKYYSFRRATHRQEANYGRLISAIMLNP